MSVRRALLTTSSFAPLIKNGKQALKAADRQRIAEARPGQVVDSLDLDAALKRSAPNDPRWDYVLGTTAADQAVIAVEVHPANTGEARLLVAKKKAAVAALAPHLAAGRTINRWHWVATGTVKVTRSTPEARMLDQAGIRLPVSRLTLA